MPRPRESSPHGSRVDRAATLRRIPSLDGLRAVSILMVLGLHSLQRIESNNHVPFASYVIFNGGLGVSIFFVISGYLITRLLLQEQQQRGSISLAAFYLKRAFRILPPFYLYFAVLLALALAGRLVLSHTDLLSALFLQDYASAPVSWTIEHFWTLSVEEQFYLLWPLVLLLCFRASFAVGRLRATAVAIAVILLSPALRIVSFRTHNPLLHNSAGFHMHADMVMFGCAGALLEGRRRFESLYGALTRLPWLPFAVVALGSYLGMRFQNYWNFPLGETLTGLFVLMLMLWCVRNARSPLGRLLNHPALVHLGVLSYSIYIWQTLLLNRGNGDVFRGFSWISHLPQSWLVILLLAELSHRLVELPFNGLRNRVLRQHFASRSPSQLLPREPSSHAHS